MKNIEKREKTLKLINYFYVLLFFLTSFLCATKYSLILFIFYYTSNLKLI